jgi:hypothetical protein
MQVVVEVELTPLEQEQLEAWEALVVEEDTLMAMLEALVLQVKV